MKKRYIFLRILCFMIGLIFISIPFWVLGTYNEEVDDLPCYDKYNHLIKGVECKGIENKVMDKYMSIILTLTIIGTGSCVFTLFYR